MHYGLWQITKGIEKSYLHKRSPMTNPKSGPLNFDQIDWIDQFDSSYD